MKTLPLTKGYVTIVDDADFELIKQFKWHAAVGAYGFVYAGGCVPQAPGQNVKVVRLHRFLMQAPAGLTVDHINRDTLDNRRSNLRICTHAQNCANRQASFRTAKKYKGVSFQYGAWKAKISPNYKSIHLGTFETEIAAALAYDAAAREYFGDYALLNFPNGVSQ